LLGKTQRSMVNFSSVQLSLRHKDVSKDVEVNLLIIHKLSDF
jgi:hypothetical protein